MGKFSDLPTQGLIDKYKITGSTDTESIENENLLGKSIFWESSA
jgi:hypothetical protein